MQTANVCEQGEEESMKTGERGANINANVYIYTFCNLAPVPWINYNKCVHMRSEGANVYK